MTPEELKDLKVAIAKQEFNAINGISYYDHIVLKAAKIYLKQNKQNKILTLKK